MTVPGVILAGGASRRMGRDKAMVALGGRPLLAHVRTRLAPQCTALAINAAEDLAGSGLTVLPDGAFAGCGPLAGILAALDWGAAQGAARVLTAPVDTPFLPWDLVRQLSASRAPIALAATPDGLHGTVGLWSVGLRDALQAALEAGARKVTAFTDAHGAEAVPFATDPLSSFLNVNKPEDLAVAEDAWSSAGAARFDTIVMVDWSAASKPTPVRPSENAIHIATARSAEVAPRYARTRSEAMTYIETLCEQALSSGERVLIGFDFPFGYPAGFAAALTGKSDPFAVWRWLAAQVTDTDTNANNRLDVADAINGLFSPEGPFWSHPATAQPAHVPFRKPPFEGFPFAERRRVETVARGASTCFQLFGAGAVASQSLLGLPRLQGLRTRFGDDLAVRPFETRDAPIILTEMYPSLLAQEVAARAFPDEVKDATQVRVMAEAAAGLSAGDLDRMLRSGDREEGWIFGLDDLDTLRSGLGPRAAVR